MTRNKKRKLKCTDSSYVPMLSSEVVFQDSHRSIRRALKHIEDLKVAIERFSDTHPYKTVIELYSGGAKKAFKAKSFNSIPDDVVCSATDAIYNLRASLDQAIYSAADAAKKSDRYSGIDLSKRHWEFPIKSDLALVNNVIASICEPKGIPAEIGYIICRLQPYRGGAGEAFFGLLKAANESKHRNFIPMISTRDDIRVINRGSGGVFSFKKMSDIFLPVGVDTADPMAPCGADEILMLTTGVEDKREYEIEITLKIKFVGIPSLDSNDCVSQLTHLVKICEDVVCRFSAAYVDLGICK